MICQPEGSLKSNNNSYVNNLLHKDIEWKIRSRLFTINIAPTPKEHSSLPFKKVSKLSLSVLVLEMTTGLPFSEMPMPNL